MGYFRYYQSKTVDYTRLCHSLCKPLVLLVTDGSIRWSHELYPHPRLSSGRLAMQGSWIDGVWEAMKEGKYYSIQDLANESGCTRSLVADVTRFLAKYGFAERIGGNEPLFTRAKLELSPTETIKLLECITEPEVAAELPSLREP